MYSELEVWPAGGGRRQPPTSAEANRRMLAETIGAALGVEPAGLTASGRGNARTAFARHIAIYLACTRLGLSFTEAGGLFGRDRTTAAHACRRVEERRDEPETDRLVDCLDRVIDLRVRTMKRVGCQP